MMVFIYRIDDQLLHDGSWLDLWLWLDMTGQNSYVMMFLKVANLRPKRLLCTLSFTKMSFNMPSFIVMKNTSYKVLPPPHSYKS